MLCHRPAAKEFYESWFESRFGRKVSLYSEITPEEGEWSDLLLYIISRTSEKNLRWMTKFADRVENLERK